MDVDPGSTVSVVVVVAEICVVDVVDDVGVDDAVDARSRCRIAAKASTRSSKTMGMVSASAARRRMGTVELLHGSARTP